MTRLQAHLLVLALFISTTVAFQNCTPVKVGDKAGFYVYEKLDKDMKHHSKW